MIRVKKLNEVQSLVLCDNDGMAKELSDFFSFYSPGFQFSPQFRNKKWDGKIRLYDTRSHRLYNGLIPYLDSFKEVYQYDFEIEKNQETYEPWDTKSFLDSLNLPADKYPRDYQFAAVDSALNKRRGIVVSPTGSGKSLIIYCVIRALIAKGLKGVIVVPTTSLVEQMYKDFEDYSSVNKWSVDKHCHRLYANQDRYTQSSGKLLITTWQSLVDFPRKDLASFDFVIGDEAHGFKANSLTYIMRNLVNASYRIGTTGTTHDTKVHMLILEGLFGEVFKVATTKELMDRGQLAKLTINCLVLKHNQESCKLMKGAEYPDEITYLINHSKRNLFIRNLALSMKDNTLILFKLLEHGERLYQDIKEKAGERPVFYIAGKTPVEEREEVRALVEKYKDAIIVASLGTFSTGINIKRLHNIIAAAPSKSKIRVLQSIGRSLRLSDDKSEAVLYDIADDMRVKKKMNHTLKHFLERVKLYEAEKFPYSLHKVQL